MAIIKPTSTSLVVPELVLSLSKSHQIKKEILKLLLSGKSHTYAELERKVNTGYRSIVSNCEELRSFNAVKITKLNKHEANGRPYYKVEITSQGRSLLENF